MFETKTYDNIMSEMLDGFGNDVNTDEGSLAYNAVDKIAEKLEDVYADMDLLNDNLTPDTMDFEHLIQYGEERGIKYSYATAPIVKGEFEQEIEIGQQFACNDFTYTAVEQIENFDYKLVCDTEGTEANTNFGQMDPVDYIDDYRGGEITEILTPGSADEDIEVYRSRVKDFFKDDAFGGNKADYRKKIDVLDGVGGCKPKRRDAENLWIYVYIIGNDLDVPDQKVLTAVQNAIDPEQSHGEGDGLAPIGHNVLIKPVEPVEIKVAVKITWEDGYSTESSKSLIDTALKEYLLSIRMNWEKSELNNQYVRISQVEAKILATEGVLDIADTKVNEKHENLTLAYTQIPVWGGVTIV